MGEDFAQLIGADLTDVTRRAAQGGNAGGGIGGRTTGDFHSPAHAFIELFRLFRRGQRHGAFDHAVGGQKIVVGARENVDNRRTNPKNV